MREEIEKKISKLLDGIGCKLYDIETLKENDEFIFRVSILKNGGVSLDVCVEASRLISPLLDVYSPVDGEYRLEVSSPGIERSLKTIKHYEMSVGEEIKITLKDKTKLIGKLLKIENETIFLEVENETKEVEYSFISKGRTHFKW